MAERRMFAKSIIDSDMFLDMPLSAQALYFHLSMRADDDGFINNPKRVQRMIGANDDDFKLLIAKQFIIPFDSGIVVIKHWRIHNYIRSDRYKPTIYSDEKATLSLVDGVYTSGIPSDGQTVYQTDTQVRVRGRLEDRLVDRLVCCTDKTDDKKQNNQQYVENCVENVLKNTDDDNYDTHTYGKYKNVFLTEYQYTELCGIYGKNTIDEYADRISCYIKDNHKRPYRNHYDTIKNWLGKDHVQPLPDRPSFDLDLIMDHAKNTPLIGKEQNDESK